ncbi:MAG: Cobalt-precorrin-5A hydrolase [Stenotrophomonas maltophilia]|nr:MAG: Cobalt-precorrin-5A hydrolase [Stenotrophomonas maltophilia]
MLSCEPPRPFWIPHVILVAGLGCRRGCPVDELHALLCTTLAEAGLDVAALSALASAAAKADEPGLRQLAERLGLPIAFLSAAQLAAQRDAVTPASARVQAVVGEAGVCEAAALAQARILGGQPARLCVEKRRSAQATCALAMFNE